MVNCPSCNAIKSFMNKKLLPLLFVLAMTARSMAQAPRIDTVAVSILDRMSAMIGDLSSCSVTIRSNYDIATTRSREKEIRGVRRFHRTDAHPH